FPETGGWQTPQLHPSPARCQVTPAQKMHGVVGAAGPKGSGGDGDGIQPPAGGQIAGVSVLITRAPGNTSRTSVIVTPGVERASAEAITPPLGQRAVVRAARGSRARRSGPPARP